MVDFMPHYGSVTAPATGEEAVVPQLLSHSTTAANKEPPSSYLPVVGGDSSFWQVPTNPSTAYSAVSGKSLLSPATLKLHSAALSTASAAVTQGPITRRSRGRRRLPSLPMPARTLNPFIDVSVVSSLSDMDIVEESPLRPPLLA